MPAQDERRSREAGGSLTLALAAIVAAAVAVIMAAAAPWSGHLAGASSAHPGGRGGDGEREDNGAYLLQPGNPADGATQTLDLMPGEGGFAEFTVPGVGRYEMLDHHLDHAAAGAAGCLIASG